MNSLLRWTFIIYFVSHIPITMCIDMQGLFPSHFPQILKNLFSWYINQYNDSLMRTPPIWLKSFLVAEATVQFPFFFLASYALIYKKNWIRIPGIIYGTHVATTVIPILSEILYSDNSPYNKQMLFIFYFPYFLIPFLFMATLALNEKPFSVTGERKKEN